MPDTEWSYSDGLTFKYGINVGKRNNNLTTITALCIQSPHIKQKPHEINAALTSVGKLMSMTCSCKARLGKIIKIPLQLLYYYRYVHPQLQIIAYKYNYLKRSDEIREKLVESSVAKHM